MAEQMPHAQTPDVTSLTQQLAEKAGEIAHLRKTNAKLIFSRSDLEAKLRAAHAGREREKGEAQYDRGVESTPSIERLQSMAQVLRSDLEREYLKRHALADQLQKSEQQRAALEVDTGTQRHELDRLRTDYADLSLRLHDTEAWLQGILASKSYRIMAPARRLRALFRRG